MSNVGLGVMIKQVFGNYEQGESVIAAYIGRKIVDMRLDKEAPPDGALFIDFEGGKKIKIFDDGRSCCENRYLHTDDKLEDFIGSNFMDAETRDGPAIESEYGEPHEMKFLLITTSKGTFTLETHNEHNGYYGGFWLTVEEVE